MPRLKTPVNTYRYMFKHNNNVYQNSLLINSLTSVIYNKSVVLIVVNEHVNTATEPCIQDIYTPYSRTCNQ